MLPKPLIKTGKSLFHLKELVDVSAEILQDEYLPVSLPVSFPSLTKSCFRCDVEGDCGSRSGQ